MLQSMVESTVPTRAEVSDVANAVFDGTDAVMTSAETSISPHPALVVKTMAGICSVAESGIPSILQPTDFGNFDFISDSRAAISGAILDTARGAHVKAIFVFSTSGKMVQTISKRRPNCPIIAFVPNEVVAREINLFYGVYPIILVPAHYSDTTIALAESLAIDKGYVKPGDNAILTGGIIAELPALTLVMKLFTVGDFISSPLAKKEKESKAAHPGALANENPATLETQEIAQAVKHEVEKKSLKTFSEFVVTHYATQVVAGTNYFLKINVGSGHYVHARVFKDLQQHLSLHSVQTDKKESDHLDFNNLS